MKLLRRVPILARCLISFGVIVGLLLAIVLTTVLHGRQQDASTRALGEADATAAAAQGVKYALSNLANAQGRWALAITRGDTSALLDTSTTRAAVTSAVTSASASLNALENRSLSAGEKVLAGDAATRYADFVSLDAKTVRDFRSGDPVKVSQAQRLINLDAPELVVEVATDVDELVRHAQTRAAAEHKRADALSRGTRVTVLALGIAAVVVSLVLAALLTSSITRPLRRLHRRLIDMAEGEGDLTRRLDVSGRDEVAAVSATFNAFVDRLQAMVLQLARGARDLAAASQSGSSTATELTAAAAETSRQAAAAAAAAARVTAEIASVASSIEETTAVVREIATSAAKAATIGQDAAAKAADAAYTMRRVGEGSERISTLVQLITTIARQTHLLALNARIEAGSAGAAGSSFAVVAQEVKQLADSTAVAVEQIMPTIGEMQGDTMQAVSSVSSVHLVVDEIAQLQMSISSAVEQTTATASAMAASAATAASGSAQISVTAEGVARAAEAVTAGAAETERSAHELERLAGVLDGVVRGYRVETDETPWAAADPGH